MTYVTTRIAKEAAWEMRMQAEMACIRTQELLEAYQQERAAASDAVIEKMDLIEKNGIYDRTGDGLRRERYGKVGGEMMMCQVSQLGQDLLLTFWAVEGDGHQRRFLLDQFGDLWMDTGRGIAVRHSGKYQEPVVAIWKARAN